MLNETFSMIFKHRVPTSKLLYYTRDLMMTSTALSTSILLASSSSLLSAQQTWGDSRNFPHISLCTTTARPAGCGGNFLYNQGFFPWCQKPEQIVAPASILESSFNYSFRRTAELKNKGQKEALPQKCKVSFTKAKEGRGAYSFTGGCKLTETRPGITSRSSDYNPNDLIDLLKNL